MKHVKKILAILLIVFLFFFIFLQFAVPPIAASYVEKHSKEFLGRQVKIEDFHWNLLTFEIHLNGIVLFEQDEKTEFVGLDNLSINVSPLALITGKGKLEYLKLNGLRANVVQQGDQFNFSDILEKFAPKDTTDSIPAPKEDTTSAYSNPLKNLPLDIQLENIHVENVSLSYNDLSNNRSLSVEKISVKIPRVESENPEVSVAVSAAFPKGGDFDLNTKVNLDNGAFEAETNLKKFDLQNAYSIAASMVQIDSISGKVRFNIKAKGSLEAPLATKISGNFALNEIKLKESAGGSYQLESLETGFSHISLEENKIPVDSLIIKGVKAHFDLFSNSNNITVLLKTPTKDVKDTTKVEPQKEAPVKDSLVTAKTEKSEGKLPDVSLKKLRISEVQFTLNDYSIKKPMHYTIPNIKVSGDDINMQKLGVGVNLTFPQSGTLSMNFRGSPMDLTTMHVNLKISNMALQPFSPYSIHYTGFPLKKGTLDFTSNTDIKNNELNSVNKVLINKLEVEDKLKNSDPEFSIPMKVGLYLLKDRKDQISMDLPVKGNITDPEFSFGKIIWKTFSNLIIKVALTPTKLITAPVDALLGDDSEESETPPKTEPADQKTVENKE